MAGKTSSLNHSNNLLVEVGTEELPPKSLQTLGKTFANTLYEQLKDVQLLDELENSGASYRWFATPRRLAAWVPQVLNKQPDQEQTRRGPALTAAFDANGNPTQAAIGFAKSCGASVEQLDTIKTEKGEWLTYTSKQRGLTVSKLAPQCIEQALKKLPIPKRMRWGDLDAEFIRPVHWLVVLLGNKIIKTKLLSVEAGDKSWGHRFHHPRSVRISHADRYEKILHEKARVIVDFANRREVIYEQVEKLASKTKGQVVLDESLLDEVTALVEWPYAILGEFEKRYLKVPAEVLVSSMRDHQKYFHLVNKKNTLLPFFITVSNIKSKSPKRVREGNERVLQARLADALFFWESDRKAPLRPKRELLAGVMFHKKLGSVFDKTERMKSLAGYLAQQLGADRSLCERAATLAKVDLVTELVGEFPELQGVMGKHHALLDGEHEQIADAAEQHYRPAFAGDELPEHPISQIVAIADKVDTLVGIFATGEEPTGDKDPYGLRRAALGVLRILIEKNIDLDLKPIFDYSASLYRSRQNIGEETVNKAFSFTIDRLRAYYAEEFRPDELASVAALNLQRPKAYFVRLEAVREFRQLPEAQNLAAANKRISNILKKADDKIVGDISENLLIEEAEKALAHYLVDVSSDVWPLVQAGRYNEALKRMARLQRPVDRFFDEVMVMTDDENIRNNRLSLLSHIHRLFLSVADISKLQADN